MEREKFGSRLGFILVSAGCAIGLGNVWKFPYICAQYGGGAFILLYLVFLGILGYPILISEFAVGRGSKKSLITNPKHLVLEATHPSPFSCNSGFFGSRPFSKTNKFLKEHNLKEIDFTVK